MLQKVLLGIITIVVIVLGVLKITESSTEAYVNLNDIYQKFTYQEVINAELDNYLSLRQTELDSLDQNFETFYVENKNNKESVRLKYQELNRYKDEVSQVIEDLELNTENKIWKLINEAVNQYGETHNLDFIYGVSGSGTLMYAKETYNITDEIVHQLNSQSYD